MPDHAPVLRWIDMLLAGAFAVACAAAVLTVPPVWSWGWGLVAVVGTTIVFACPVAIVVGRREHRMLLESPVLLTVVLLLPAATAIAATVLGIVVGTGVRARRDGSGDVVGRTLRTVANFAPSVVLLAVLASRLDDLHWLLLVLLLEAVHLAVVMPVPLLRARANRTTATAGSLWPQLRLSLLVAPWTALTAGAVVLLVEVAGPQGLVTFAPVALLLAWGRRLTHAQQDRRRLDSLYGLVLATGDVERPEDALTAAVVAAQRLLPGAEVELGAEEPQPSGTGVQVTAGRWLHATRPTDGFTPDDRDALAAVGRLAATAAARAELQDELERQDRIKTALLAAAGHDLRTPLIVQSGLAARLLEDGRRLPAPEFELLAERIAANAGRMAWMVDGLVDLERLELARDAGEDEDASCDPVAVVRDWVARAELDPSYSVQVVTEGGRPAHVVLPAPHLERVVENLLVNAMRHCPVGEPVTVRVRPHGHEVLIAVEDRGPGVPPEERERIFQALHQGTSRGAAGLGLFIVARLVEHVGGRVQVTDRDGGGASFQVWLPTARGLVWTGAVEDETES